MRVLPAQHDQNIYVFQIFGMVKFVPTPAALDAVFNAKEVSVQHLNDRTQDTSERFSVRGKITQVGYIWYSRQTQSLY